MYHQTSSYKNIIPVYTVKEKHKRKNEITKIKERIAGHTEKLDNIQKVLDDLRTRKSNKNNKFL